MLNITQDSVSQPPGAHPGTGTWNIKETKNLSETRMKSSIFKDKVIRKIYYRCNWPQNYYLLGQKTKKLFYRDLNLKRLRTIVIGD